MDLNRLPDGGASGGGSQGSESDVFCSICLDPANKDDERTVVKLKCSHEFHLDCIGSAFNAKKRMECPNCRKFEKGEWRFDSGFVPIADHWNYEDEEDEGMIGQSFFPQMAFPFQWCPFNDIIAPIPVHFNEGNVFASSYTQASGHQWSGPFVPAEAQVQAPPYPFRGITIGEQIIGPDQTPISLPPSTHPFPAPQSPYYQGAQPIPVAALPSHQQHYYPQQAYNAPLPSHPAQTLSDPHGPVTGSGFHFSFQNPGSHVAGFPTWMEHFRSQGWEAAQPADSPSPGNRLNSHTQRPRQESQTRHTTTWPNNP
uniref:RING-type domain-containing protein n=1 Tax=Kalanchoe fedtschenkoi TaxID=63787 RepID=A0A7N0TG83_KALFE